MGVCMYVYITNGNGVEKMYYSMDIYIATLVRFVSLITKSTRVQVENEIQVRVIIKDYI